MSDESRMITGATVGAVLAGVAAYLVFTPQGRRALDNMDATLDGVSAALEQFRGAIRRADSVIHEARGVVEDVRAVLKGEELTVGV